MLAVLLSLALGSGALPTPPTSAQDPDAQAASDPSIVVLDCTIANNVLASCQVASDASDARSAAALKMAATLKVPDEVLAAGVDHVRLKLRITGETAAAPDMPREMP